MQIKISETIMSVMQVFETAGYDIYLVGGCVRDLLLGVTPQDFDMTTNARPETIVAIAKTAGWGAMVTGAKYGTVTVVVDDSAIEITTYRIDSSNGDGRRPDAVVFTDALVEDLARRDFTINACAYSPKAGVVDPFDGRTDLATGVIRTVGEPVQRLSEDYLRMLRAVRFATRLNFTIEPVTFAAIQAAAPQVAVLSHERLRKELGEIIQADKCLYGLALLDSSGLWQYMFPDNPLSEFDLQPLMAYPQEEHWRWLGLSWLICPGVREVGQLLQTITLPVCGKQWIIRFFSCLQQVDAAMNVIAMKRTLARLVADERNDFVRFMYLAVEPAAYFVEVEQIFTNHEPLRIEELAIDGHDLLALGLSGKEVGSALAKALDYVYRHPMKNTTKDLLLFCKEELKV